MSDKKERDEATASRALLDAQLRWQDASAEASRLANELFQPGSGYGDPGASETDQRRLDAARGEAERLFKEYQGLRSASEDQIGAEGGGQWREVENDDAGSLLTGVKLEVGDRILIQGEDSPRKVTYVMGSERAGWRACFKGQGPVPQGQVYWHVVEHAGADQEFPGNGKRPPEDLSKMNLRDLAGLLKPGQAWSMATILVGLLGGAFALGVWIAEQPNRNGPALSQRWLVIEGIEADQHEVARITVAVNGDEYISFPAAHVWAELKPTMPKERYPLPVGVERYSLRFAAFLSDRGPAPTVEARCQQAEVVSASELPILPRRCDLFPSEGSYWGGQRIGVVRFSVVGGQS